MSRYIIDADQWLKEIECGASFYEFLKAEIPNAPTIKTKQIKYYDEDEKVWKTGSVIVDE